MNLDAILTELIVSFEILTERNRADLCLTKKDAWERPLHQHRFAPWRRAGGRGMLRR